MGTMNSSSPQLIRDILTDGSPLEIRSQHSLPLLVVSRENSASRERLDPGRYTYVAEHYELNDSSS